MAIGSRPHAEGVKVAYLLYPGFADRTSSSPVTVGEATCLPVRERNAVNSTATLSAPARAQGGGEAPSRVVATSAWIVAGSLAAGLVAALVLAAAPFVPAEESALTGAVLCGFAVGWAMLAVLSIRLTDQPQRWAAAPALFMGLGGLLLVCSARRYTRSSAGCGHPPCWRSPS